MAGPSAPAASCAGADAESAAPPHGRRDTEPVHESREFSSCQQHSPSPASKPPPAVTAPTGVYVPNSHSSSNSKSDASIEGGQPTAGARNEPAQLPPPAQSDSSRAESGGSKRGGVLTGRKRKFTPEQNLGTRRSPRLAEQGSDVEGADAFFLQLSIADSESARQRSKRIRKIGSKRPAAAPGTNGHVVTPVDKEGVGGIAVGKTGGAVAALAVSAPPVVSAYTCNNKKKPTPGAPPNGKKDDVSSTAENSGTDDMKMKSKSVKTRQPGGAAPAVLLFSPLATRGQRREKAVGKVSGKGAADGASAVSVSKGRARTGHANTSSIKNTAVGTSAPAEATPSPTTARDEATLYASKDFGRGAVSGRQGTSIDIPTLEPSVQEAMLQLVSEQFGPIAKSRRPAPKAAKGKVAKGTVAKGKVTKGTVKGKAAPHSAPDGASGGTFRNKTSVGMGTAAVAVGSAPAPTTSLHASWGGGERSAAGNGEDVSVVDKKSKRKTTKSGSKGKAVCSAILGGGSSVAASGGMLTTAQKTKKSTIDPDNSNATPPSDPDGACGGRSGGESSVRAAVASAAGNGEDVSVVDKKSKRKTTKSGSKGKAVCSAILGGGSSVTASGDEGMLTTAQKTKKSTIDPDNSNATPPSDPDGACGGRSGGESSVRAATATAAVASAAGNGEDVSVVDKKSKRKTTKSGSKGKAVCSAILGSGGSVAASGGMLTTAQKTKKSTIDPDNSNAAPPSDPDGACGGRSGGESSVRAATATAAVASAAGNGEDVSVVDKKSKRKTTKSGSKGKAVCSAILGGGSSVAASGGMLTTAQKTKKSTIDPDNSNAAPPSDPDGACGGRSGGESSVRAATATAAVAKVTVHAPIYTVHSGDRGDSGNSGEMSEFSARASIGGCVDEDRVKGGKKRKWSAGGEAKGQQEVEAEEGVSVEEHRAMTAERQYGADAEEKEVGVEERTAVMAAIADEGRGFKRVKVVASTPGQNHHQRDDTASASAVQPSPAVATELPPAVPTESAGKKTRVAVPPPNVDQSEANATSPGPTIEQQAPGSGTAAAAPVRATTATAIATAAAPVPAPVPSPAPPVVTKAKKKVGRKPVKKGKKPPPKSAEQVELERYTQSLTPEPPLHDVTDTPTPACFFLREEEPANGSYSDTVPTAAAPAQLAQVIDLTGFDDEDGDECDSAVGESGSDKKGKGRDMSFPTRSDDLAQKHLRENQDRYMDIVAEGKPCTDHNLIPPQVYGAKGGYFEHLQQPFRVEVHPNVLFVADVHAYAMDAAEIIGILAGRFDPVQNVLHVQAAVPCKEERREGQDKGHTDVAFDTMSYFEAGEAVQRQGLQMVGWYHSHPKFTPDPSPIDIKNHQTSQADEDANPASPCRMVGLIVGRQNSPSKFTWFRNETVTRRVSGTLEDREVLCPMLVETTVASGVPSSLRTQGRESGAAACTARKKSRDRARSRIYELDAQRRVKRARLEAEVSGGEMMSEPASASAEESTTRAQAPPESDSSGMPSRLSTLAAVAAAAAAERDDHLGTRDDDVGPAAGDAAAAGGGQARTAAVLDGDFHAAIGGMARDPPLLFSGEVLRVLMGTSEAGGGDGVAGGSGEDAAGVQGGYGSETKVLVHALTSLGRYYARMARRAAWGNRSGMTPLERLSRSLAPTLELMEIPLSDAPDFLKDTALFLLSCFRETNASLARKTRGRGGPVKNTRAPRRSGRFGD